jgi:hypothetical protein
MSVILVFRIFDIIVHGGYFLFTIFPVPLFSQEAGEIRFVKIGKLENFAPWLVIPVWQAHDPIDGLPFLILIHTEIL